MKTKSFDVELNKKIKNFKKTINVDSDKSLSIRSFLLGSISHNISELDNVLESEDVGSTITCLKDLGIKINKISEGKYNVFGKGLGSLAAKKNTILNFGNSGTLARLLIGILSTTPNIKVKLTGDESLKKRNMAEVIQIMRAFGADFKPKKKSNLPIEIKSSDMPIAISYKANVSAQLKSAAILAGLNSFGNTEIIEDLKFQSRDHTENLLLNNSNSIQIKTDKTKKIIVKGQSYLKNFSFKIPGDPSSAAFFAALTLLTKNSSLRIKNVGLNPKRIGFYKILKNSGAKIAFKNKKKLQGEIIGDIIIKSSNLKPLKVKKNFYVSATDEYPIMFVIAALTKGISCFKGIEGLKNKESDRVKEMQKILKAVGIKSIYKNKELKIFGKEYNRSVNKKIFIPNLKDHRICMSSAILALLTGNNIYIKNFETVNTSSPSFLKIIKKLNGNFKVKTKR